MEARSHTHTQPPSTSSDISLCAAPIHLCVQTLYTGVYANGGPTNIDRGATGAGGLASHLDRSAADVRGVKK